jgi:hypothetical protein
MQGLLSHFGQALVLFERSIPICADSNLVSCMTRPFTRARPTLGYPQESLSLPVSTDFSIARSFDFRIISLTQRHTIPAPSNPRQYASSGRTTPAGRRET